MEFLVCFKRLGIYYALGLFAYKGEAYQQWTRKIIPFEQSAANDFEKLMLGNGQKSKFLNLQSLEKTEVNNWLFESVNALEMENGGVVSFVPVKRFDGVITIRESKAPTYD